MKKKEDTNKLVMIAYGTAFATRHALLSMRNQRPIELLTSPEERKQIEDCLELMDNIMIRADVEYVPDAKDFP